MIKLLIDVRYWLYYLNNLANSKDVPKVMEKDKVLHDAFKVAGLSEEEINNLV